MPRMQLEATELKNTDVNFVSLVKHGANRIPFRIVKEDKEAMLDLGKIGRQLFRKADAVPAVVAVLVNKSADQAKIAALLSPSGLVMTQKTEEGEMAVYAQPGVPVEARDGVLRLSEDVALVISGLSELPSRVQKDFCSYDSSSTSFLAVMNTEGFFPSMMMATSALQDVIMNIMSDASDPATAASMIGTAIDDYKSYVVPCVSGIPVRAFKSDVALRKASEVILVGIAGTATPTETAKPGNQTTRSNSGIGDGANANGTGYDTEEDRIRATKAEAAIGTGVRAETSPVNANQEGSRPAGHGGKTVTSGESPIGTDTTREPGGIEGTQEGARPTGHGGKTIIPGEAPIGTGTTPETSPVNQDQGRGDVNVADLMKGVQDALTASVAAFRTEVLAGLTEVKKDVGGITKRIDGVEARTRKAEEAIGGTALGLASEDPTPRSSRATKSEGPPPLLDTGFSRAA